MSNVKEAYCYGKVQYGEFDVSEDRNSFIGGSDIPVILGISSFKKRFQLLLEKAGLEENTFHGNRFTEYGHIMEPKIRDFVNMTYNTNFLPARIINGDMRCHMDGFNDQCVLEIKTTSDVHSTVDGYKVYLVQLIKYMSEADVKNGLLAVYGRPEDMSTEFDGNRMQLFGIALDDYRNLLTHVNRELDRFRSDLERLKENPLLTEEDFMPVGNSLAVMADKVIAMERQLSALKETEAKCKEAKAALYREMVKHDVKSWTTPNGTKVTLVAETPAGTKTVEEFDQEAFRRDNPGLFQKYMRSVEKQTGGRSGYVKITVPR